MAEAANIPDDFLPPEPPPTASSRQIDFTQTNPPLRDYARTFAAVIDDVLTPSECAELIRLAEASATTKKDSPDTDSKATWERAMINIGNGHQMLATDTRNCGRIIYDAPDLAGRILARIRPFLEEYGLDRLENKPRITRGRRETFQLTRLNDRLRFLKYEGGEYFRPHWDGLYATPDEKEMSFYTIHLYLNGDGEQDLAELKREEERIADIRLLQQTSDFNSDIHGKLLGGATSFIPRYEEKDKQVRVFPRTGSVLVFQQSEMLHGGDPVFRGTKFTVRTDIMYSKV